MSAADGLALLGAVLLAAVGGEAFLRAIIGAAAVLGLPKAVVASTLLLEEARKLLLCMLTRGK